MASLLCACEMLDQFINVKVIAQHLKDCENEVAIVNCFIAIICYLLVCGKLNHFYVSIHKFMFVLSH